ncbi:hypothetical protein TDB9533_01432 [Thalassocella blandensis]|nr:hypothetical protein TDB9533_01432 [Thalassocella blandensis]
MLHRCFLLMFVGSFTAAAVSADPAPFTGVKLAQVKHQSEENHAGEPETALDPRRAMQHKYMQNDAAAKGNESVPSFQMDCPNHKDVHLNIFFAQQGWEFSPASMIPETFDKGYAQLTGKDSRALQASCIYRVNTEVTATHSYSGNERCAEDKKGGIVAVKFSSIEGYSTSKIGSEEPGVLLGKNLSSTVEQNRQLVCTYQVKGLVNLTRLYTADMDVKACRSRGLKISCR